MAKAIKEIIRILRLGPLSRWLRKCWYAFFDALINTALFSLRAVKIISPIPAFEPGKIKKILIIRIDRIGDLILSTPSLRAVRENFPQAEINLLVSDYTADLVVKNPFVNKVLRYKIDNIESDYDLAIALHPGILANKLTYNSGAKWRVGYKGSGGSFYLTHPVKDDRQYRIRHEIISALEVVKTVGCGTEDLTLHVSVSDDGEQFARNFWIRNNLNPTNPTIIIHPGSRQEYIRWSKSGFVAVADRLIEEKQCQVILIGAQEECSLVEEVVRLMKHTPLTAIGVKLNNLISIIRKAQLFIGNSTGPMHLAAALGVPVVAIFGSKHPLDSYQMWGPWSKKSMLVRKEIGCRKCHPTDCRKWLCMQAISTDDVFDAAKRLLALDNKI